MDLYLFSKKVVDLLWNKSKNTPTPTKVFIRVKADRSSLFSEVLRNLKVLYKVSIN